MEQVQSSNGGLEIICVYYNETNGDWSTYGQEIDSIDYEENTINCKSTHLSIFTAVYYIPEPTSN